MNEMDLFIAKTQRQLAFLLIWILVLLVLIVCVVLLIPTLHINSEITGLLIQVVTGVLALAGTAVGYFFARHRPPTAADGDNTPPNGAAGPSAPLVIPEKPK
jgi:flagellar basal body-associated protein FliL